MKTFVALIVGIVIGASSLSGAAVISISTPFDIQIALVPGTNTWQIWSDSCRLFTVETKVHGNAVLTCQP